MKQSIEHIGTALKRARIRKALSQQELARRVNLPQAHISKIERGLVDLQTSTLIEIGRTLELELMLIPIYQVPIVQALSQQEKKQMPMYALESEDEDESFEQAYTERKLGLDF